MGVYSEMAAEQLNEQNMLDNFKFTDLLEFSVDLERADQAMFDAMLEMDFHEAFCESGLIYLSEEEKASGIENAIGKMKVDSIIGFSSYETPENRGKISVIPESELVVSDEWEESPNFGIYKVTWSVTAGDKTDTIEKVVFLIPPLVVVLTIIVLTFVIIWIIMLVRKRKEHRSRLAV
jgi:hypothetical protein